MNKEEFEPEVSVFHRSNTTLFQSYLEIATKLFCFKFDWKYINYLSLIDKFINF